MAQGKKRRRRRHDRLVLELLIIVAVVIFVFEGRLIQTMITQSSRNEAAEETVELATEGETDLSSSSSHVTISTSPASAGVLAGLSDPSSKEEDPAEKLPTVSDPYSSAIVPEQPVPVDDSYFDDAVFIGDSRMEGFRNTSGITSGTFFTSVGMSLSSMTSDAIISDGSSSITVAAALSGGYYRKIYIMCGANDLGEYDWDNFREELISVTERFMEIQPDAIMYLCSCIYVEEDKVTTGYYVNNENVDKLNSILLEVCEEKGYYYLDFNEVLSNGYGALIAGASADGIHLNEAYCEMMLDYLKTHYIPVDDDNTNAADADAEYEAESEEDDFRID